MYNIRRTVWIHAAAAELTEREVQNIFSVINMQFSFSCFSLGSVSVPVVYSSLYHSGQRVCVSTCVFACVFVCARLEDEAQHPHQLDGNCNFCNINCRSVLLSSRLSSSFHPPPPPPPLSQNFISFTSPSSPLL